jgi:2-methylcitrate dehydratase PrpD
MDIERALVRNLLKTRYADLPQEAVEISKLAILDTIGCAMAGATVSGCDLVREQVLEWGGKKESMTFVFGDKVPCANAAFVNSTMARALDFDSTWERGLHMSAASIPTALAVAQMCRGISGRQFLTAIVAGEDLAARVHLATTEYNGFEPTGVCGVLGTAAIAGKIRGLDERKMLDALSIAFNRSGGSYQPNIEGTLMVRVMEGLVSRAGIESALLAQRGITGGEEPLEGVYGYFHLFSKGTYDAKILTDRLGKEFLGSRETTFKKFPACQGTATAIGATLRLVSENDIRPDDVDEIIVEANPFFHKMLGKPFQIGGNPQVDAQFSYPYTVASSVVQRRFTIHEIMPTAINTPEVLAMAEKVHSRVNDHLEKESFRATIVTIKTKQGCEYSLQLNHPKGSRKNPMNRVEIIDKFRSCMDFSERPFLQTNSEPIIKLIEELENVDDVNELAQLLYSLDGK